MAPGLSIAGIGGYPMGLGTMGLSAGGSYGNYDNYMSSMMGMNGSLFNGGAYGMGMMNMYNPAFYTQMMQMQNQAEQMQLQHAGVMHNQLMDNKVSATRKSNSALIEQIITDGGVKQHVVNLHNAITKGVGKVTEEFDKARNYILNNYRDELAARGTKINPVTEATEILETVYANVIYNNSGESTLKHDIERYGEGAMTNGFLSGLKRGHSATYVDRTMNHCFGTSIADYDSKEMKRNMASYAGRGASLLEKGVWGAGAGLAIAGVGTALTKTLVPKKGIEYLGKTALFKNASTWKTMKTFGKAGFWVGLAADLLWQISDSKSAA